MLAKAPGLAADEIVIDLEDAVAPTAKDQAREQVLATLAGDAWAGRRVSVRVNAPRTPWCHHDLIALATLRSQPASVIVPKVEGAGDLAFVDRLLDGAERRDAPLRVQALIETAAGLSHVQEIAAASVRLEALILGYADLGASLGRRPDDLDNWRPAQERLLLAARTHGLMAIDGPHLGVRVDAGFHAAVERARAIGFDGKWAIHPAQLDAINGAFTPADDELDWARNVIASLAAAERRDGAGAVNLNGQMIDEAVRVAALRTLARAGAHA